MVGGAGLGCRKESLLLTVKVLRSQFKTGIPFSILILFNGMGSGLILLPGNCSGKSNMVSWLFGRPESPLDSEDEDDEPPLVSPLNGNAGLDASTGSGDVLA